MHDRRTTATAPRLGEAALKRALDLTLALIGLVVISPLLLLVAGLVCCSGSGGPLYRQTRVGRDKQVFVMYKFRTMRAGSSDAIHQEYVRRLLTEPVQPQGGLYKLPDDPRITKIGGFLRKTSIDELPQLFNVVRGDMSLVGPRPALPYEVDLFPEWAAGRFAVRPGITGLWQVSGRNRLGMLEGLRLDLEYVARRSVREDLTILVRTLPAILHGGAR
jgi:lipopolysaccharide/colanic/teichoic acid biosynthesis glycosyltransferase